VCVRFEEFLHKHHPRQPHGQAATGAEGVNILINNGAAAGQVVFHLHIHVVPRVGGDELFRCPPSKGMIAADAAKDLLARLHPHV
jgi:histidine triad (HIT) family protein